ncbi:hypothetical protein CLAFUW4_00730 [Fulvia fulva]|uniref:HTH La-type RNA-binding domain-containing protein n=1 Tax=Passalora fulva TaxID=5499 RepID=A0A9Q8L8E5_PASFU|nr:uncharacterized protein CLAFUR5_00733 [Fulvia fulva]KAK4634532.1 hypothetical protein CLAFUR4_00731 [Fulvia fulva]KAK4638362.1 hypothetical protein CLAFUR0_00732 [Fulvia fulva]UJO12831.1 hypothetical protein CLAFUR5_00733 [Fulvia fulva]WPV08116.1 hypothetical protein CLAFUW4_00730 [Fulvia fulva]WPV24690.1 hypothetical protein CLAFUW7_00735 [Fulvia fulva]
MAALNQSPSGFSYAQAAKGRSLTTPSKTPSSKVTSGTATPATGAFSELGPNSNWADDVEATVGDKNTDTRKVSSEQSKSQAKDSAVERTKSESRPPNGSSGVSTPDLTASSTSTSNPDEQFPAQNGTSSSDTTWETKSQNSAQNSEPAWIAERKERQSGSPGEEGKGRRGKKEPKEPKEPKESATRPATPKAVVLTDAPPPVVNPWAKRMETAKAKPTVTPSAPRSAAQPETKENQQPSSESRKNASSVTTLPREVATPAAAGADVKKSTSQSKRASDARHNARQSSKQSAEDAHKDSGAAAPAKAMQREHQSLPNLTAVPPPVKDDVAWPTPETAQEKERKDTQTEKEVEDNADAEATAGAKREKTKWKPVPVTPTIVWQTEEMNRPPRGQNGERGGRGGNGARGRGGFRGAPNGSKGGDRTAPRNGSSEGEAKSAVEPSTASNSNNQRSNGSQSQEDGLVYAPTQTNGQLSSTEETTTISATAPVFDARRSYSSKMEPASAGEQQDIKIPEPIPRQSHPTAQVSDAADSSEAARDGPTIRRVPSDGRKEARPFESLGGKEWNGASRGGGKRGGRGRGGSREYSNGHQASQPFVNGHADFVNSFAGVPPSPSAYPTSRSPYPFTQQGRGGWQRGASRSQSIPLENVYGGRQFWPGGQLPPMQTYMPGMYDYQSGAPYTAVPFHPMAEHQQLLDMVHTQLDYYFSMDNLLKDMFLRKNMDGQGFVFLDTIANFNRVKQLTADKEIIRAVCLRSDTIEIRVGEDGKERLRRREGWEQFVLPNEQRETAAQTEGPQILQRPEQPHLQFWTPPSMFRGPPSAGIPGRRSYDSGFPMNGGVPGFAPFSPLAEAPYGDFTNGEEGRGRSAKSPIQDSSSSPGPQAFLGHRIGDDSEPDVFPNQNIEALTVVVRPGLQRSSVPHHHAASRTFSNGSIDTRSIQGELEKSADDAAQPTTNGEPVVNGDHNGAALSRHTSPTLGRSPEKGNNEQDLALFWCKDKELPQEKIPQDGTTEPYITLRAKAIKQRDEAATGNCPYDLDVLYQFWSHFLIRNFNKSMYREFQELAHLDAQERRNGVGMRNLVLFYAKALSSTNPIRDNIIRDYVALVNNEPQILGGAAYKQLRQAWRDGALNLKNRKKLADILDEALKTKLEGQA